MRERVTITSSLFFCGLAYFTGARLKAFALFAPAPLIQMGTILRANGAVQDERDI